MIIQQILKQELKEIEGNREICETYIMKSECNFFLNFISFQLPFT